MGSLEIRRLHKNDIQMLTSALLHGGVNRDESYFHFCLDEMISGKRVTFVALMNGQFAGTCHFLIESKYPQFKAAKIPEINDLVVIPDYREMGIGNEFMKALENYALVNNFESIGLGVGLYKDYGSAQRLYVKRGYVPDGHGVLYDYQEVEPGKWVLLDDELNLCFTKTLAL